MDFKTLKECSKVITKGTTPSSIGMSFSEDGINFVKSESITEKKFLDASIYEHISEETNEKLSRSQLQENDLLFSIAGAYLAKVGIVRKRDLPANTNQAVGIVRIDETQADYNYLYYYFSQKHIQEYAKGLSAQSAQPNLNLQILGDLEFIDIPLNKQKRIADLLSYIDDKIENNDSIIFNLENLAKTLYDYWFVQFDFPDANGNPYKNSGGKMEWNETLSREIPAGWEVRKVKDIEAKIVTGKTPSTARDDFYNGNIPFVTIGDIRNHVFVTNTDIRLTKAGAESQSNKYLPPNSLCVSCIASPGEIGFTTEWSQTNQQINSIVIEDEDNRIFLYFALKDYFLYNAAVKTGNTFANMSKTDFSEIALVYPTKHVLRVFAKKTQPIFRELKKAELENRKLITFRDFLLPMLMNGQVTFRQ